jgi:hypothetical protein
MAAAARPSVGRMLVPHPKRRQKRAGLRDALRQAQKTYREYSRAPEMPVATRPRDAVVRSPDPDVVLDVPNLKVDEIDLELDELKVRIALEAHVLDLLKLDVGADASLGRVNLKIKGVEAQALLKVRLDNLATILDRVMDTIDANPQILERVVDQVGGALGDVGRGAGAAVGELGGAVGDVGRGAGSVVEEAGHVAGELGRKAAS